MKSLILFLSILFKVNFTLAEESKINFYGFILPSLIVSDHAVESYGRPNSVAYTAAGNPVLAKYPFQASQSFQVAQSRFGIKLYEKENIYGLLEFDFVDFNKSTPAVAALARLRRATINFKNENFTFNLGQDWDLFSPLAPYTYNFVGHYFSSGDLGFMRIQAQVIYKDNNLEHAFAVGFPNYNNSFQQSTSEYSMVPTISARETFFFDSGMIGVSGIYSYLNDKKNGYLAKPWAINLFFKKKIENFEFSTEVYLGANTDNISLLGLGFSQFLKLLREFGGFFTLRNKWNNTSGYFLGIGYASIIDKDNLDASYTYVAGKPTLNMISSSSTGYGIIENLTLRVGYEYFFSDKLAFFVELAYLNTHHKLDPADLVLHPAFVHSQLVEFGAKLDF